MKLTTNILTDFFRDRGWTANRLNPIHHEYDGVRLFFSNCRCQPEFLYIAPTEVQWTGQPADVDFCLVGPKITTGPGAAYHIIADSGQFPEVYSAIQGLFDDFSWWDQALSNLLLNRGTLQDILDISARILKNPCFFLDNQYNVLASVGQVPPDINPFFHETVEMGRAPNRFFEDLLSLPQHLRDSYLPRNSVNIINRPDNSTELLANYCVDGIPLLRFCMVCINHTGSGIPNIVAHLMERIRPITSTLAHSAGSISSYDCLFGRIIDNPADIDATTSIESLGLQRYDLFCVFSIDFGAQHTNMNFIMEKLRLLHPRIYFFLYHSTPYALAGATRTSVLSPDEALDKLCTMLCDRLDMLGATYSLSNPFTSIRNLSSACFQASYAWRHAAERTVSAALIGEFAPVQAGVQYFDVMLYHMLSSFFSQYPFELYCPRSFLRLLEDELENRSNNLNLLLVYLSHERNATTARLLHMHRNNVIYRINRLKEKYSIDFDDSMQRILLYMLCLAVLHGIFPSDDLHMPQCKSTHVDRDKT